VVAQVRALKVRHEEMLGRKVRHGDKVFVSPEGSPLRPPADSPYADPPNTKLARWARKFHGNNADVPPENESR
jgi:hypothetical protein